MPSIFKFLGSAAIKMISRRYCVNTNNKLGVWQVHQLEIMTNLVCKTAPAMWAGISSCLTTVTPTPAQIFGNRTLLTISFYLKEQSHLFNTWSWKGGFPTPLRWVFVKIFLPIFLRKDFFSGIWIPVQFFLSFHQNLLISLQI